MVLPQSIKDAFMKAALTGKDVRPEQILSSMYGKMGGIFGRLEGPIGAATVKLPSPPELPKPMQFKLPSIFGKG